jgi:peptidoglycan/xylan/chitin deacetylase (PgdA/CDA1 family)
MAAHGVRGTFFLTANYCRERADFLRAEDIRALAAEGFDFGTHGVTHRPLKFLPPEELKRELSESKAWLEETLGAPVRTMSLPAGQGGSAVCAAAFRAGYRLVGTSREASNGSLTVPGTVNRFVVLAGHGARDVVQMAGASPAYVWKRRLRAAAIWLPKRLLRTAHRTREQEDAP